MSVHKKADPFEPKTMADFGQADADDFVCPACGGIRCGAIAVVNMKGEVLLQSKQYVCLAGQGVDSGFIKVVDDIRPAIRDKMIDGLARRWMITERTSHARPCEVNVEQPTINES